MRKFKFCKDMDDCQVEEVADFLADYAIIIFKALENGQSGT